MAETSRKPRSSGDASTTTPAPTETEANPQAKTDEMTGPVGTSEVIDAQEHVLGDDPRRVAHKSGYHDSLTGRPVNESGTFVDTATAGSEGPVPKHRIVADDWPNEREKIDDSAKREGNDAA